MPMSPLGMALAGPLPSQPLPTPTVAPTDAVGAYRDSYAQQMAAYKAKMDQQNAMWGGLASMAGTIGGAMLGGPMGAAVGGSLGKGLSGMMAPQAPPTFMPGNAASGFQSFPMFG